VRRSIAIALTALLQLIVLRGNGVPTAQMHSSVETISVTSTVPEWLNGYQKWARAHPSVWHQSDASNQNAFNPAKGIQSQASSHSAPSVSTETAPALLLIRMPLLEVFSARGDRIYHGELSAGNAAFLESARNGFPASSAAWPAALLPSLADYIDIVPELGQYKRQILGHPELIVLSVSFSDKPFCKPHNDALRTFKRYTAEMKVRLIEVKLRDQE